MIRIKFAQAEKAFVSVGCDHPYVTPLEYPGKISEVSRCHFLYENGQLKRIDVAHDSTLRGVSIHFPISWNRHQLVGARF